MSVSKSSWLMFCLCFFLSEQVLAYKLEVLESYSILPSKIRIGVLNNGCTKKQDFMITKDRVSEYTVLVSITRTIADNCRAKPESKVIDFPFHEVGIKPFDRITFKNQVRADFQDSLTSHHLSEIYPEEFHSSNVNLDTMDILPGHLLLDRPIINFEIQLDSTKNQVVLAIQAASSCTSIDEVCIALIPKKEFVVLEVTDAFLGECGEKIIFAVEKTKSREAIRVKIVDYTDTECRDDSMLTSVFLNFYDVNDMFQSVGVANAEAFQ